MKHTGMNLRQAVETVCEGWTLPDDVRKILETALYAKPETYMKSDTDTVCTVALVLNDNDFGNTFRPLLDSLYRAIVWNGGMSREAIKASVLEGLGFHYTAFQHGTHFGESGYQTTEETVKYLKRVNILFNEDAEADICQNNHDGGAWYLEVQSGNIASY